MDTTLITELIKLLVENGVSVAVIGWFMTVHHKQQKTIQDLLTDFTVSLERLVLKVEGLKKGE